MDVPSTSWANPYKHEPLQCFVPKCPSDSLAFPNKLFLYVPREPKAREKWLKAAGKLHVPSTADLRCCEDHFDIHNDIEWPMGRLKQAVVPHIFICQQRTTAMTPDLKPEEPKTYKTLENMEELAYPPYQSAPVQQGTTSVEWPNMCMQTPVYHPAGVQGEQMIGRTRSNVSQIKVKSESATLLREQAWLPAPAPHLCCTCLATDRLLYSLKNAPQYLTICNGVTLNKDDLVCYECRARLDHFLRFRSRALRARRALAYMPAVRRPGTQISGFRCLSTLAPSVIPAGDTIFADGDSIAVKTETGEPDLGVELIVEPFNTPLFPFEKMKLEGRKQGQAEDWCEPKPDMASADDNDGDDDVDESETDTASETAEDKQKEGTAQLYHEDFIVTQLTLEEVRSHMQSERETPRYRGARYKCAHCALVFYHERHMRDHTLLHDENRGKYKCVICEQRFKTQHTLKMHSAGHYSRFQCRDCRHVEFSYKKMYEHYRTAHDNTPRFCRYCDTSERFTSYAELRKHVRTTHRQPHPCEVCDRSFRNNSILQRHILMMHTKVPIVECQFCHKKYKGDYNLKKHVQDVHEKKPDENAYCTECDMQFPTIHRYRNHLRNSGKHAIHQPDKFECDHCGKKCKEKASLRTHIELMHLKLARYKCPLCDESFPTKSYLNRHNRKKHTIPTTPAKRYVCHLCEKSFTIRNSLDEHLNTHLGVRPYVCKHCGATFSYKAALFTHNRLIHLKMKRL